MKRSVSMLALLCTIGLLLSATDPDNHSEVRQAQLLVTEQVHLDSQAMRQGVNLDRLSPTELVLLWGARAQAAAEGTSRR